MENTAVATTRKITPLGDRVLVRPAEAPEMKGGLYMPEVARERPQEGVVVAVGDEARWDDVLDRPRIPIGASVLYGKYVGTEVEQDGEALLLLRESDVLAVISEAAPDPTDDLTGQLI